MKNFNQSRIKTNCGNSRLILKKKHLPKRNSIVKYEKREKNTGKIHACLQYSAIFSDTQIMKIRSELGCTKVQLYSVMDMCMAVSICIL